MIKGSFYVMICFRIVKIKPESNQGSAGYKVASRPHLHRVWVTTAHFMIESLKTDESIISAEPEKHPFNFVFS